jgi:AraC-like DNA-binding protein
VALARFPPGPDLGQWVERYWTVRWDLTGADPYRSEVLPHPTVHVTFESGTTPHYGFAMPAALVHGPPVRRFTIDLSSVGRAFGVKFRPGGFGAFTGENVGAWRGQIMPIEAAFGQNGLLAEVLAHETDEARVPVVEAFLHTRMPTSDPAYDRVMEIVAGMIADSTLISVDSVTKRFGIPERSLQRLFRRYVGVGPKWMLRRYRLHDAVTLIDSGGYGDLATLAASLGWYDQAHFTREFTAQVGQSPSIYATRSAGDNPGDSSQT